MTRTKTMTRDVTAFTKRLTKKIHGTNKKINSKIRYLKTLTKRRLSKILNGITVTKD